jgi:hypothetical protein
MLIGQVRVMMTTRRREHQEEAHNLHHSAQHNHRENHHHETRPVEVEMTSNISQMTLEDNPKGNPNSTTMRIVSRHKSNHHLSPRIVACNTNIGHLIHDHRITMDG